MSQAATTINSQSSRIILAKTDTVSLDGITLTASFQAVDESGKPTYVEESATRELVESGTAEAGYKYYAASSGGDAIEVTVGETDVSGKYKARIEYFEGTDLTDENGVSKYWTGSAPVAYSGAKKVGVAKVHVVATAASDLTALLIAQYGKDPDHKFVLTVDPAGQMTVAVTSGDATDGLFVGEGEGKRTEALAVGTAITFDCALANDGTNTSWDKTFYYATRTNAGSGAETSHATDAIEASISGIE